MKKINLNILAIIGLLIIGCQPQKETNPIVGKIELELDSLLVNPEFEAVSLGVIIGKEEYIFHEGSLLDKTKPNDETLYEIASLTKTFTGTLLAQAINEEKIVIDADIREYLPENLSNLTYDNQPIKIQHLVTHQSGLPNMFPDKKEIFNNPNWDKLPFTINELQKDFSREDFFSELEKFKLDTFPGLNFTYSNCGANLIGYILEEIYQKPFEELLQQKILNPLNMTSTKISKNEIELDRIAYGQNSNKIKMPLRVDKAMNAEGGIITSTKDMLKFLQVNMVILMLGFSGK